MNGHRSFCALLALALFAALFAPHAAFAAGTGDDPRPTKDVLTPTEAKAKAVEDAKFKEWLAEKSTAVRTAGRSGVRPMLVDAPNYSIWTPSHAQERSYWCAPATVQIIDDYWGPASSQASLAAFMGTTVNGTDFSRVDDALRYVTGKSYYYYGNITSWSAFTQALEYGIGVKHYPIATDVVIDGGWWPFYNYDHAGHVIPIEGFDERVTPYHVRINDPYDESYWRDGGGPTFGHTTYDAYFVATGIQRHFRHAVVR